MKKAWFWPFVTGLVAGSIIGFLSGGARWLYKHPRLPVVTHVMPFHVGERIKYRANGAAEGCPSWESFERVAKSFFKGDKLKVNMLSDTNSCVGITRGATVTVVAVGIIPFHVTHMTTKGPKTVLVRLGVAKVRPHVKVGTSSSYWVSEMNFTPSAQKP